MKHLKKITAVLLAVLFALTPLVGVPFEPVFAASSVIVATTSENPVTHIDDTVTLSVSFSKEVTVKSFALDFSQAYDHDVFEWVDGQWSDELQFSALTDVDTEHEVAAVLSQTPITVKGEVFTFTLSVLGAINSYACDTTSSVEVAVSGIDGAVTEAVQVEIDHLYPDCDEYCFWCGESRGYVAHRFANDCAAECDGCGETRVPPHSYTDEGDDVCNLCGQSRTVNYELITNATPAQIQKGGEVSVTVSLSKPLTTKSFALDLLTAYDHNAFEWISGAWADEVQALGGFYDVQNGSEAVFLAPDGITIPAGEVFAFTLRVKDGASCRNAYTLKTGAVGIPNYTPVGATVKLEHTYTSECDPRCDVCESPRTPTGTHTYDNSCDTTCNVCGATRLVAGHVYEYPCATTCLVCGDVRGNSGHTYDHDWDDDCNVCGEIRSLTRYLNTTLENASAAVGETVTVNVSLSDPLYTVAIGLDFENAYDHTKFEWVDGYWSSNVEFNAMSSINPGVDAIFLASSEFNIQGLLFTMVLRVKDAATCEEASAIKVAGSNLRGAIPVGESVTIAHSYENDCDGDCNVCGEDRVVTGHVYDNACDTDCNVCGSPRTTSHSYDHEGDEICNECGEVRIVNRDLTTSVSVNEAVLNGEITVTVSLSKIKQTQSFALDLKNAYDHNVFEWVSGSWSSAITAKAPLASADAGSSAVFLAGENIEVSGEIFTFTLRVKAGDFCEDSFEIKVPVSGLENVTLIGEEVTIQHVYDNACDADCNSCGETRVPADHVYDDTCDTDCNVCGDVRTIEHTYDNACDADCNVCGDTRVPADHVYDNACDADCNVCGDTRVPSDHVYDHDGDEFCNECGTERPVLRELTTTLSVETAKSGDTITVSLSFDKPVPTIGFGFDFDEAYDHDVFEWIDGVWCETVEENALLLYVDPASAAVFGTSSEITLTGTVFTFTLRVKDTAVCENSYEIKALSSHLLKNVTPIGDTVTIIHNYSVQDKDDTAHWMKCSVCGTADESTREAHGYENACDATCDACGYVRIPSDHVYDNNCDTDCNVCGDVRTITHDYSVQDKNDTEHWMKCSVCGAIDESTRQAHGYANACDATCDACGYVRVPSDHVYDNNCDTDCNVCGDVRTITHDYTAQDKNDTEHWMKCSVCGTIDESTREAHGFANTCDTTCDECGYTRTTEHVYDNACDADCNVCGDTRVPSDHVYDHDGDPDCNECGAVREIVRELITTVSKNTGIVGDTFTVTVTMSKTAKVQSFALDLLTAYDHNAFEWVSGGWSAAITDKAALADVVDGDAAVFLSASAFEVSGEIFTFTLRAKSCAGCETPFEIKVPASHLDEYTPVGTAVTLAHSYTNVCDADCNGCGELRAVSGHEYDHDGDETCNKCGELRLAFYGTSLTLQHNFAINYKVKAELAEKYTDFYVVVEMNGKTVEIRDYTTSSSYLSFRFDNIAPQAIGDTVTATLYAKENGEEVATKAYVFGVKAYCEKALEIYASDSYAAFRTLIVDLLHYGAKAQAYTGYKTGALVDADLTAAQLAWGTQGDPALENHFNPTYETITNPTATWYGAGLVLDSAVTLKLKFKADSVDGLMVRVAIEGGKTIEIPSQYFEYNSADGLYYLYVNGINANQMSRKLHLTILDADGNAVSNTAQYSIESYAYEKQNSTIPGLADLVKAMMNYGKSAVAYAKA